MEGVGDADIQGSARAVGLSAMLLLYLWGVHRRFRFWVVRTSP